MNNKQQSKKTIKIHKFSGADRWSPVSQIADMNQLSVRCHNFEQQQTGT